MPAVGGQLPDSLLRFPARHGLGETEGDIMILEKALVLSAAEARLWSNPCLQVSTSPTRESTSFGPRRPRTDLPPLRPVECRHTPLIWSSRSLKTCERAIPRGCPE